MLDIKFVRENPDAVKENIKKKFQDAKLPLVDEAIALDAERRQAIADGEALKAERNKLSKEIGALMGQGKTDEANATKETVRQINEKLTALGDARAEAEAISAILYPNDAGEHGRLLRLKQEYLFVSAGIYSLLDTFEKEHGENWELLPQFVAIHTNDTHPAMCGPELMRILIDEYGYDWDTAWSITTKTFNYTCHTLLPEALEVWPASLIGELLPRHLEIIEKIQDQFAAELKAKGEKFCDCDACKLVSEILDKKDYLAKKSVWIFGGDGWAYDIGYGGLDHVIAQNKDVNIFVFDTEVYSNTGGQASKASNIGQVAQFAAAGKETKKKSLSEIAMQYGYVYVAQVAMGANPAQTLKAITEAEAYHGPSLIIGYSPCEMHSIKGGMMNCQKEMKKAVECGYWNLFRFNPAADKKFTLDSKAPAGGYREFLMNEARYSRLTREFPERAEELFAENEQAAMARWSHLQKLKDLYAAE